MMKKKTFKFLALSVLVALTGVMVNAWANGNYEGQLDNATIWEDQFQYKVTSLNPNTDPMQATVTVVANNLPRETTTAINIPDDFTKYVKGSYSGQTIEGNVKFTVNAIGDDAFADLPKVKEIEIPAGIESIGADGFDNLGNLKTVTFAPGSKLKSIGDYTFGITNIEEVDFSNCADLDLCGSIPFMPRGENPVNNQLKKVTLPNGMKCIGTAFANCPKLAEINLENTAIEEIPEGAFEGDAALTSLTLPALAPGKTLVIGPNAFCGTGITELTINSDLTTGSLTPASFAGIQLQTLTINGKLIGAGAIPAGVFAEKCNDKCSKGSLKTLVFNGKIVAENAIATDAVKGLTALETLTFGQIAKNGIAEGAFQENVNTASGKAATITFNGVLGLNAIGKEAFKGSDFKKIVFAEDLDAASIGEGAFMNTTRDGEAVVEFQGILAATGAVGKDAFKGSDVTKVEFKQSIIQAGAIAESAFEDADQLSEILFDAGLNETDAVAANAFKSAGNNATLYVGSINASQAINSSAFEGASIKYATFNALNATEAIAPNQFKSDVALAELTINGDLKKENIIGASAFDGTENLGSIKLTGNILVADAIKGAEGSEPFNGAGSNKATTLDLKAVDQIVAGGIGEYAFAQSGINSIELNSAASNLAQEAFAANSFLNIPQKAVIKYNPAQQNIKGHSFNQEAFAPAYQNVDIKFQTNAFVKKAYEVAEGNNDLTPWRIKFMLNIELTLETAGIDGFYYTVWAPQDEMYYIEKYQENGAVITVYSAYFDDLSLEPSTIGDPSHPEDNVVYFNPLRLQADGKYVLNADEALLIKSTKPFTVANPLQAKQNIKDDSMDPLYPFGGIQTFAGLNVRQSNDLRYAPWQIYKSAYENNRTDWYDNILSDYYLFRLDKPETMPAIYGAHGVPANGLYILATDDRVKRGKYSGGYEESWIAKYEASEALKAAVIAALQMTDEPTNEEIIEELMKQIANKDLDPTLAGTLQAEIDRLNGLETKHIKLLVDLIKAQKAIDEAEQQLEDAENSDANVNPFAIGALNMAYYNFAAAVQRMQGYTLGVIYLAADRAYDTMKAYYDAQDAYEKAYAEWIKAHNAYNALVTETENTDEVDYIPVIVLTNVDADGNEIEGYVGKTYYVKADEDIQTLLGLDEAAGARKLAEEEAAEETETAKRVQLYVKNEQEQAEEPADEQQDEQPADDQDEQDVPKARLAVEAEPVVAAPSFTATGIWVSFDAIVGYDYSFTTYGDQEPVSYFSTLKKDNKVEAVGKTFERYTVTVTDEVVEEGQEPKATTIILFKDEDGKFWTVTMNEDKQWIPVAEYTGDTTDAEPSYTTWCKEGEKTYKTIMFQASEEEQPVETAVLWASETDKAEYIKHGQLARLVSGQGNEDDIVVDADATTEQVQMSVLIDDDSRTYTIYYYDEDYYALGEDGNFYNMPDPVGLDDDANTNKPFLFWSTPGAKVEEADILEALSNINPMQKVVNFGGSETLLTTDGTDYYFTEGDDIYQLQVEEGVASGYLMEFADDDEKFAFASSLEVAYETREVPFNHQYYLWTDEDGENFWGKKVISEPDDDIELSPDYYVVNRVEVQNGYNWTLGDIDQSVDGAEPYYMTATIEEETYDVVTIEGQQGRYIILGDALILVSDLTETEGVYTLPEEPEYSLATGNEVDAYTQGDEICYDKYVDEEGTAVWGLTQEVEVGGARMFDGDDQQGGDQQGDDQQGGDQQGGDQQGDDQQGGDQQVIVPSQEEVEVPTETTYYADLDGKKPNLDEELEDHDVPVDPVELASGTVSLVKENGAVVYETVNGQNFYAIEVESNETTYGTDAGFNGKIFYVIADEEKLATGAKGLALYAKNEGDDANVNPFTYTGMTADVTPAADYTFTSYPSEDAETAWATGTVDLVLNTEGEPAIETALEGNGTYSYTPGIDATAAEFAALADATDALNDAAQDLAEKAAAVKDLKDADAEELEALQTAADNADDVVLQRTTDLNNAKAAYDQIYAQCEAAFAQEADGTNFAEFMATEFWHNLLAPAQAAVDNAQMRLYQAQFNAMMAHAAVARYIKDKKNTELLASVRDELFEFIMENTTSWTDSEGNEHLKVEYGENFDIHVEQAALLNYVAAKQALENAQKNYDAAQEGANEAAIDAAKKALAAAKAQFDEAMAAINADDDEHSHVANAEARMINVVFNDGSDPVGIMETVVAKGSKAIAGEGAIYNLQGIRVNKASKGVFIQNGVKVVK